MRTDAAAATSNAPTIGRKRRLSTPGEDDEENAAKRARGDDQVVGDASGNEVPDAEASTQETEEVKEVTQGVKEVGLDAEKPETIPLPATPPPETEIEQEAIAAKEEKKQGDDNVTTPADGASLLPAAELSTTSITKPATELPASEIVPETPAETPTSPRKTPRKTRKLPTKTPKSTSKAAKKVVEAVEPENKASGEVAESKDDVRGA